jgi:hypothetical protein
MSVTALLAEVGNQKARDKTLFFFSTVPPQFDEHSLSGFLRISSKFGAGQSQLPTIAEGLFTPWGVPPQSDSFRASLIGSIDKFGKWGVEFI